MPAAPYENTLALKFLFKKKCGTSGSLEVNSDEPMIKIDFCPLSGVFKNEFSKRGFDLNVGIKLGDRKRVSLGAELKSK
ncbi:MAG: hypothetical protein BroJett020_09810 [Bacteroidota bacterium]|nr:MAG: hypothetical protein BroJett020_09810 [Bacteroidota bacterium]